MRWGHAQRSAARYLRRARTSTLRNLKGVPSVMRRGIKDLPAHRIKSVSAMAYVRLHYRQLSSIKGARWPRQHADTHRMQQLVAISANRCGELCRHAAARCWLAVCVHNTRATPPRLRACANYHTHLPEIKRPPRQQLLGHQVGDADDETTRQTGAPDVASKYMRVTFRRGVLVRRQQRRRPSSSVNTLRRL